jgi:hypothetical protein
MFLACSGMQRYPFEVVDVVEPGKEVENVAEAKGRSTAGVFHVANSWSQIVLTVIGYGEGFGSPNFFGIVPLRNRWMWQRRTGQLSPLRLSRCFQMAKW